MVLEDMPVQYNPTSGSQASSAARALHSRQSSSLRANGVDFKVFIKVCVGMVGVAVSIGDVSGV